MALRKFYTGNLHYECTEQDVREFFGPFSVKSVKFITDRETNRPRGFGFVEVDCESVDEVVSALDGHEMLGRKIVVNEAKPQEKRGGGERGGGDRGGNRERNDGKKDRRDRDWER